MPCFYYNPKPTAKTLRIPQVSADPHVAWAMWITPPRQTRSAGFFFSKGLEKYNSEKDSYGGFLKWWYPTTMGFPIKNDHFGGVLGVPLFTETSIWLWCFWSWKIMKFHETFFVYDGDVIDGQLWTWVVWHSSENANSQFGLRWISHFPRNLTRSNRWGPRLFGEMVSFIGDTFPQPVVARFW